MLLGRQPVVALLQGLAQSLVEKSPDDAGAAMLRTWVGAPDLEWRPDPVPDIEWTPDPGPTPEVPDQPESAELRPALARDRELVLPADACPFCGGALAPPGRLYLKGTLKDIRFLPGLSGTLDLKQKVLARPCTVCGQISLRLQENS